MKRQRENDLRAKSLMGEKSILDALPRQREQYHLVNRLTPVEEHVRRGILR